MEFVDFPAHFLSNPHSMVTNCFNRNSSTFISVIPILTVFSLFVLSACAGSGDRSASREYDAPSAGSDCIFEGTIRDYQVLDESNLLVSAAAKRKYHIELSRRAYGLRSSWHIGFASPTSRICPGFSEVIVDDNLGLEAIRIARIRALSPEEADDLLIRFGKKEPEIVEDPAPAEVEGAEVEELD